MEAELHELRSRLFELMQTDAPDTSAIFALVDSVGSVQGRLQKEAIVHIISEGAIFTPKQKRRFFDMLHRHMDERWKPHGGRGHGTHHPGPLGHDMMDGKVGFMADNHSAYGIANRRQQGRRQWRLDSTLQPMSVDETTDLETDYGGNDHTQPGSVVDDQNNNATQGGK
jgi:hypothetical protein